MPPLRLWLVARPLVMQAATGPFLAIATPSADDPALPAAAAERLARQERLLGVLLSGFSVLGLLVAWAVRRRPDPFLHGTLWVVPLGFAALTAVMVLGEGSLAAFYGVVTALLAFGVALAPRRPAGARAGAPEAAA